MIHYGAHGQSRCGLKCGRVTIDTSKVDCERCKLSLIVRPYISKKGKRSGYKVRVHLGANRRPLCNGPVVHAEMTLDRSLVTCSKCIIQASKRCIDAK